MNDLRCLMPLPQTKYLEFFNGLSGTEEPFWMIGGEKNKSSTKPVLQQFGQGGFHQAVHVGSEDTTFTVVIML